MNNPQQQSLIRQTVFDIRSQEVMTLQGGSKPPGKYQGQWNGLEQSGD